MISGNALHILRNPDLNKFAADHKSFVKQLKGPTVLLLAGHDTTRWRAIATLLHGNEPSGLIALHRWFRQYRAPAVNTLVFFGAVKAASREPLFTHRSLPGERDLNRCFGSGHALDEAGKIAIQFKELLEDLGPECLIDLHNTSGRSGAYGLACHEDPRHEALIALFSQRVVITRIKLGSLMEIDSVDCPSVTIECGGAAAEESIDIAWQGLNKLLFADSIPTTPPTDTPIDVYHDPARLELTPACRLEYANHPVPGADLIVPTDIDRLNYGVTFPDRLIARTGPCGTAVLRLVDSAGERPLESLFLLRDQCLFPSRPLKIFMATSNKSIALSDCLLYAAPESGHDRVMAIS